MKAADVISTLRARGVGLWKEGESLRYRVRLGVLTEQDKATLKRHKAAILRALEPPPTEANRRNMPHVAELVDEFRLAFGSDQVRVIYAEENGVRLGRQEAEPKAGICYYCRHWCGTKSGNGAFSQ